MDRLFIGSQDGQLKVSLNLFPPEAINYFVVLLTMFGDRVEDYGDSMK